MQTSEEQKPKTSDEIIAERVADIKTRIPKPKNAPGAGRPVAMSEEEARQVADAGARGNLADVPVEQSIKEYLEEQGIATNVATVLVSALNGVYKDKFSFEQRKWAVEELMKMGVGGGYKALETISKRLNVNINFDTDDPEKLKQARDKLLNNIR